MQYVTCSIRYGRAWQILGNSKSLFLAKRKDINVFVLALPVNVALAAIQALFHFRVVREYHIVGKARPLVVLEGIFIAYLYSIFVILDTTVSCLFYKSFKTGESCIDQEDMHFQDEGNYGYIDNKSFEELP
jgi:hypothetical protein